MANLRIRFKDFVRWKIVFHLVGGINELHVELQRFGLQSAKSSERAKHIHRKAILLGEFIDNELANSKRELRRDDESYKRASQVIAELVLFEFPGAQPDGWEKSAFELSRCVLAHCGFRLLATGHDGAAVTSLCDLTTRAKGDIEKLVSLLVAEKFAQQFLPFKGKPDQRNLRQVKEFVDFVAANELPADTIVEHLIEECLS